MKICRSYGFYKCFVCKKTELVIDALFDWSPMFLDVYMLAI